MTQRMTIEEYKAFRKKPVRQQPNKRGNKAKGEIGWNLVVIAKEYGLTLETEYRFNPERRWRADWALFGTANGKEVNILVEFEGIFSEKSRHTTEIGYSKDTDKYRSAAILGWTVLRYTQLNYGSMGSDLRTILNDQPK